MLSFLLVVLASTFFLGIVYRVRAMLSGRKGPGIFQAVKDMVRLFKKGFVFSDTTSYIFQIAPVIYFASVVTAMLVVPFGPSEISIASILASFNVQVSEGVFSGILHYNLSNVFSFEGDFIFFAYILALGKFFLIISAMDTGSPFEGMGANREAMYGLLVEPAFFILIGSFAMLTREFSFFGIYKFLHFGNEVTYFMGVLVTYILVQIAMLECGRMPVDDPKTHLELTMIHEVMVLDNSGFDLALIQAATSLKFSLYGLLIVNFFLPPTIPLWLMIAIFFAVQIILAITVALLESFRARSRMNRNPLTIFSLTTLSILIFFAVLIIMNKFSL
jgi:formate hydrogenlyase subunit 4